MSPRMVTRGWVRAQVGVVEAWLDAPHSTTKSLDGTAYFRGSIAVILRGPALVRLAFPFKIERIPIRDENYWEDLRIPQAQFSLPL